ncbi:MAG: DUF554 family protein, partial [Lentisphaeria bacterium]|nr:DUF554 family protein [Lentisphaeria bacterium]
MPVLFQEPMKRNWARPGALWSLINTAAVLGGSLVGMILKRGLKPSLQDTLMKASGVAVLFIGL